MLATNLLHYTGLVLSVLSAARAQVLQIAPAQCYEICNDAVEIWESVGFRTQLCDPAGNFATAFCSAEACIYSNANNGQASASSVFTFFASAVSYCNSIGSEIPAISNFVASSLLCGFINQKSVIANTESALASLVQVCASFYDEGSTTDPAENVCTPLWSALAATHSTAANVTSTQSPATSLSPSPSSTSIPTTGSTSTPQPPNPGLSTGAIAGIAVGAAVGGILIFVFVLFFIWRHRKNKLKRTQSAAATDSPDDGKAQLHSDDFKPRREEMEGSRLPSKIRTVGGLSEMEHTPISAARSEMRANEPAASEMENSTNVVTNSSTAVDSSSRQSDRAL